MDLFNKFFLNLALNNLICNCQVSSKRDALEEKSTGARNDYLLSLAAANAHQNRYFVVDLQSTMQVSFQKDDNDMRSAN